MSFRCKKGNRTKFVEWRKVAAGRGDPAYISAELSCRIFPFSKEPPAAQTNNLRGSGGVKLAGHALDGIPLSNAVGSGGGKLGGVSLVKAIHIALSSGGVRAAGQAIFKKVTNITPTGGVVVAGQSLRNAIYRITAAGGAGCGGVATVTGTAASFIYNEFGSGGIAAGGLCVNNEFYTRTASGGIVAAGNSVTQKFSVNINATGGVRVGGNGDLVEEPPVTITAFGVGNPQGQSPNVFVRDITNNFVLYKIREDDLHYWPASTTKTMTLLLTYEYKNAVWDSETVTITQDDITQVYPGFTLSSAGFQAGDVVTWHELSYGLLLPSGFDACQAMARVIGDMLYANAGNTGNQGVVRFIERMNERAAELGMTGTVYFDTFGGSKAGATIRNIQTARNLNTVSEQVFQYSVIRAASTTPQHGIVITGGNARTMTVNHADPLINGPSFNQSLIKDDNILASKTGGWNNGSDNYYSNTVIWNSPNGTEVLISLIGSESVFALVMDMKGIMYALSRDFPYLAVGSADDTDPNFSNVKLLVGADGSLVDESSVGRALTNSGTTIGNGIIYQSTGGIAIDDFNDGLTVDDAPDLTVGSGDMTIEMWYQGTGSVPGGSEVVWFSKLGSNTREWAINLFGGSLGIFASADGANWNQTTARSFSQSEINTLFNGALRHIALTKSGSTWAVYLDGERLIGTMNAAGTVFDGNAPLQLILTGAAPNGMIDDFRATFGTVRYTANMLTLNPRKFPRA